MSDLHTNIFGYFSNLIDITHLKPLLTQLCFWLIPVFSIFLWFYESNWNRSPEEEKMIQSTKHVPSIVQKQHW